MGRAREKTPGTAEVEMLGTVGDDGFTHVAGDPEAVHGDPPPADPFDLPATTPNGDDRVDEALSAALSPMPAIPPVPLVSSKEPPLDKLPVPEGEKPGPHFGTPRPLSEAGTVPRVVHQLHRAPAGYCRYKIHCRNYSPQPIRYILSTPDVPGEVAARRLYLQVQRLDEHLRRAARNGSEKIDPPDLVVTKLAD